MTVKEYEGDLLEFEGDAILHQCNCMSTGVSGLAHTIFTKFPHCNTYHANPDPSQFGGYRAFKVEGQPFKTVVNLYTQLFPGPAGFRNHHHSDTSESRLNAFQDALTDYLAEHNPTSIAVPRYIGCGLAGGDWSQYYKVIHEVAGWNVGTTIHIIEKV